MHIHESVLNEVSKSVIGIHMNEFSMKSIEAYTHELIFNWINRTDV